jgi:uncharacterized membrane protein YtjA (UPF0391 family)
MLKWALFFAVISLVAGIFGFTGIALGAAAIAKVLFFIFLVMCLFVLALVFLGIDLFT